MKRAPLIALVLGLIPMTVAAGGDETCRYLKMRKPISGYEYGGPFLLITFVLRQAELISDNSYGDIGMAKSKALLKSGQGPSIAGPSECCTSCSPTRKDTGGFDIELDRPMDPPCISSRPLAGR